MKNYRYLTLFLCLSVLFSSCGFFVDPIQTLPQSAPPSTSVPPTSVPSTSVPPTSVPSTSVPPTSVPPTSVPPTSVPPTSVPSTEISGRDYFNEGGGLELPVIGATGFTAVALRLRESNTTESEILDTLPAGRSFTILEEKDGWWKIEVDSRLGWVNHSYCFINLPDVIPSIVYDNLNAYSSKMVSSGVSIPSVTGEKLYDAYAFNERLSDYEYVVPVLYSMSKKICMAQKEALKDGNTIIIYEGFRPYEVQMAIAQSLADLALENADVNAGISSDPWSIKWFVATDISNHQKGYAIDAGLAKITQTQSYLYGEYIYERVTDFVEYTMPTEIHELSIRAAIFKKPVFSKDPTLWMESELSDTMNENALLLQKYCVKAGLTPLASEWWHFNDLESAEFADAWGFEGKFYIK